MSKGRWAAAFISTIGILGVLLAFAAPRASYANGIPTHLDLNWRSSAVSVKGYVDSLTATLIGATQKIDTLQAVSTAPFEWGQSDTPATAFGCARLSIWGGTNTSSDTIFVAVASSPDGTTWATNSTFVAVVGTSGDKYVSGPLLCDTDLTGTTGSGTIWMQRYLRFYVRPDGNTAALWTGAKFSLEFFKRPGAN